MASVFDILGQPTLTERGPAARWDAAVHETLSPMEAVMRAAWGASTVGEAFFAGYQGALENLIGGGRSKALLVTEITGNSPRNLQTRIESGVVHGSKAFAMTDVEEWWVLARQGDDLHLARVAPHGEHTRVVPLNTSFIADVPHGSVEFEGAQVERSIPDAWNQVVRPFRSVEDGSVLLALATALLGAVEQPDDEDDLLGLVAGLSQLFGHADDASFRALIGVRKHLLEVAARAQLIGPLASSWTEYSSLVEIAQGARAARLQRARERTRFIAD